MEEPHYRTRGIVDDAIGVALFVMLYAYTWCGAYTRSMEDCDKNVCSAWQVTVSMLSCLLGTWLFALIIFVLLIEVEYIFIKAIDDPDLPDEAGGPDEACWRIAFSWALSLGVMGALALAMVTSAAFAFGRVRLEQVRAKRARRPVNVADMKGAVRSAYVFNVAIMVFMIVAQMQIPSWIASLARS